MRRLLWAIALVCDLCWAQVGFDASQLAPATNLVSNPSFEAQSSGRPLAFDFFAAPQYLSLSTEQALHGATSILADVPAGVNIEAAARQDIPACPGCTYEFAAWVKVAEDRGGQARLVLQMRDAAGKPLVQEQAVLQGSTPQWRQLLVRLKAPASAALVTIGAPSVQGGMRVFYDALQLRIVAGPTRRVWAPQAQNLQAQRIEATWVKLNWVGPPGKYEVSYRQRSRSAGTWMEESGGRATSYSIVGLQEGTKYDFRVRLLWPQWYDEQGKPVAAPVETGYTKTLSVSTEPRLPRRVGILSIWPTQHLATFSKEQGNPRIEAYDKFLYVAENYRGGIYLSRIRPADFSVEWTHEVVPARTTPPSLQTLLDTCVIADKLYLLYCLQETGRPGFSLQDSRLLLLQYDLQQDKLIGEPLLIRGTTEGVAIWQGAVEARRGTVWVLWCETPPETTGQPSRLVMGAIGETALGDAHPWDEAPITAFDTPTLSVLGDELILGFSDLAASQTRLGYEPLWLARFDGEAFNNLRKLADLGRSWGARGRQLGPNSYLLYSTDAPYMSYAGAYRDIMLCTIAPGVGGLDAVPYADDMKYNISPDITVYENSLYAVYEKLQYVPSADAPAPLSYGTFIGRIDLGAAGPASAATEP